MAREDSGRNGFVRGCDVVDGQLIRRPLWIRRNPRRLEQDAFTHSNLSQTVGSIGNGGRLTHAPGGYAVEWIIPLSAFEGAAIGHHARVTRAARELADFDFAFLTNHVSKERNAAVLEQRHAYLLVPQRIADVPSPAIRPERPEA